jgi:glucose-6-phosphate 1-dehydrogenase
VAGELSAHAGHLPEDARRALAERVSYLQADVRDVEALEAIPATEPILVYLAIPPEVVPAALRALGHAGIQRAPGRIVLDKPFGLSRESARALNAQLLELTDEHNVYRIDHFLYHHVVQELIRWRVKSDPLSLVDLLQVAEVEIVWDETRASHAGDSSASGIFCDMIQSHLLQLAAVLTMDPPESLTHADLAGSRLEALRRISAVEGTAPPRAGSEPEAYAALELRSQLPRWQDARFLLRAAKGVAESRRHIELRFAARPTSPSLGFARLDILAGDLTVGDVGSRASVEFGVPADAESASTRLLRAALNGDDTFVLDGGEPEEAWRVVDPIVQARGA